MSFSKVNSLIVSLGIIFFEIGVFKLTFVKCRVTSFSMHYFAASIND